MCADAHAREDGSVNSRALPSPNDLLVLLTVARLGRHAVDAAEAIEDRLGALTTAIRQTDPLSGLLRISTIDGFGAEIVTPALVQLQQRHPRINIEMFSATRKVSQNRSGVDLEIVAGRNDVTNAQEMFLTDYFLRLYASREYLLSRGTPQSLDDIQSHSFVSYVESALLVTDLGYRSSELPEPATTFQSIRLFAQLEAVQAGAGIGLLPNFLVHDRPELIPVLPDDFLRQLPIWAVVRAESLRSAVVRAAVEAITLEIASRPAAFSD
ncbi:LysR family transcriptional regulator [Cryobacterium sp. Hz9]|nr:LysR family transcriptional regulator [Cryobacterium sp. Hz9]